MPERTATPPGPVEAFDGPDQLAARVVDPGPPLRIHGYELAGDLCRHYGFAEVVLLLLTGELPGAAEARAFEAILVWWSGASVREAPVHAAVLARLCGASVGGTLGAGAIGLCTEAEAEAGTGGAEGLAAYLRDEGDFPQALRARSEAERAATQQLREVLDSRGFGHRVFEEDPWADAAAWGVLDACGLRSVEQQAAVWCLARFPALAAEAAAARSGDLGQYPLRLPDFRYDPDPASADPASADPASADSKGDDQETDDGG